MSIRGPLSVKPKYLRTALLAAFAQVVAGQAWAQAADAKNETQSAAAPTPPAAVSNDSKITVTGSRIRRDNYNSPSPVQVITKEDSTLAGFASTAEILQGTAVTGGSAQINNAFGGFVTDGGPGANTVGLRGFSPTRSLVLLNGRRLTPSGTRGSVGAADLNVLPDAIVDHIEVLKDGASSIYGSDAVAGVINIVTRNKVDGATISAKQELTEHGGGNQTRVSVVGGMTGDRFHLSGSFEVYDRTEMKLGDRSWATCNTDYRRTAGSSTTAAGAWGSWDFIDPTTGQPKCYPITGTGSNGVTINAIGTSSRAGVGAAGSVGTSFNRWRSNSSITSGLVGWEGVGGGSNNLNVRDTFEPRMLNKSLISPGRMENLFVQGAYDLRALGNAEFYFELMGNHRDSSQTGYRQLSLDYMKGSPLIPASLAFSTLQAAPTVITNGAALGVRGFIGFGNDKSSQSVDYWKVTGGLRGDFVLPGWKYDFNSSIARSSGDYTFQSFLIDKVAQSLDVVASGTGFACRNPAGGCVAAPALTPDVIGGQLPADWVNYVWRPVTGRTIYQESSSTLGINGPLLTLPYGKVKGALGVEGRWARIDDTPPDDSINGNLYNLTGAQITRGKDSVKELYGEVEIPILSGLAFAEDLVVNLSSRYTDYKSYGSDSTYKIGAMWTPVNWLTLRTTKGTSYRAPALYEQFLGATTGFLSSSIDPCNNWDAAGNIGSQRSKNCASQGLPPGYTATSSVTVLTQGGAGKGLAAETSKNLTVGVVVQPSFSPAFGDLNLAIDYFNITVNNGVSRIGTSNILSLCYDDPGFSSGGGYCRLVSRNPATNNSLTVSDSYVNVATDRVRGFEYTAHYTRNIAGGKFASNLTITRFIEQATKLFPTDPFINYNGNINVPKVTATFDARYTYNEWTLRYGLDWIDSMSSYDYYGENPATSIYKLSVPSYAIHGVSLRYKADKWEAIAGIRNVADKEPPTISSGVYNRVGNAPLYSGYDYFGRTFYVNVSRTF